MLFQLGSLLTGAYLGAKVLASVYGAAGSVLAVLLWAHYTAQTVLFGAEFTKAHAEAAEAAPAPERAKAKHGKPAAAANKRGQ